MGVDPTGGRFAAVGIRRCDPCGQLWLHYQVEYEALSRSGRWACAPVTTAEAESVTAEAAAELIASRPWHIRGGSYWGHAGRREAGPIHWGP